MWWFAEVAPMSPDVAVLREKFITKSELANFERIPGYDVSLFAARNHEYEGLPVTHLWSPGSVKRNLPSHVLQALSSLVFGSSTYMRGLSGALSGYDVVHSVETFHGFSEQAVRAKHDHGYKVVCTVWENIPFFCEETHYSRTWRERIKHPNATSIKSTVREGTDLFLPVTERAAEALRIEGVEDARIRVVPPGVDAERFRPGRLAEADRSPGEFGLAGESAVDVVFVGRYTYSKGVYDLLSAWKRVVRVADRPVHLTMIGGGDERERAEAYARHADVPEVSIHGPVPYEDVPLVFDAADVAVLPSLPVKHWQEQYGRVMLEAQASGTPVAASRTGGIPDALGDVGLLFQPGEPLDVSEKLLSLIEDEAERQRLGESGRERIVESRTLEHTAETLADAYDAVL